MDAATAAAYARYGNPKVSNPYFRMRDGKKEAGIPFWTLYKLYQRGELLAAPLTPGGALYVKRSDFDALWKKKTRPVI